MDAKEKKKQQNKVYREKPENREKAKQYKKEWYQNNKEKHNQRSKEYNKEWYQNNKERVGQRRKEYNKVYSQTEVGKKSIRIGGWKHSGIITDDYDALYEKYINTKNCELCNVVLTTDRYNTPTTRCMDHDHDITDRDNVRNIVCHSCNSKLPKQ
mgnify:CR=1 FL=1